MASSRMAGDKSTGVNRGWGERREAGHHTGDGPDKGPHRGGAGHAAAGAPGRPPSARGGKQAPAASGAHRRPATAPASRGAPSDKGPPQGSKPGAVGPLRILQRENGPAKGEAAAGAARKKQGKEPPEGKVAMGAGEANARRGAVQAAPGARLKFAQEVPVLVKDSDSFPSLAQASMPAPKGSWGTAGRWSNPLNLAQTTRGPPVGQQPQQSAARRADDDQWITVGIKPKAAGRADSAASQVNQRAPGAGAWGAVAWGHTSRISESQGQSGPVVGARGGKASSPATAAGAPHAQSEPKKTGKKTAITLSDLMPVLRRKDVKMPTPYTAKQQAEADTGRSKSHKRSELVRNPNAADGQGMVVLRRKEKEGGKKKTKMSPLKRLILRDRKQRLERQAAALASNQSAADAPAVPPVDDAAADTHESECGGDLGEGQFSEDASKLAAEWMSERGMDASNPDHVQLLLHNLNEEEDDDEDSEPDDEEPAMSRQSWNELPSAVTWAGQLKRRHGPDAGVELAAEREAATPARVPTQPGREGAAAGGPEAASPSSSTQNIPQWAHVSAPEFRPSGAAAEASTPLDLAMAASRLDGSHRSDDLPAHAPRAPRQSVSLPPSLWMLCPTEQDRGRRERGGGGGSLPWGEGVEGGECWM